MRAWEKSASADTPKVTVFGFNALSSLELGQSAFSTAPRGAFRRNAENISLSSSSSKWSREILVNTAMAAGQTEITSSNPSLSSASNTATRLSPRMKFELELIMTATFMTVGARPTTVRICPIMPVVVDLPLVPPTAILSVSLNTSAIKRGRFSTDNSSSRAREMSGTEVSTARVTTKVSIDASTPEPSCGTRVMPSVLRRLKSA